MSAEPHPTPDPTPPPPARRFRREARDQAQLDLVRRWQRVLRAESAQLQAVRSAARRHATPRPTA